MDSKIEKDNFAICPCNNCSGRIEFPISGIGMEIQCPHCGLQTQLYQPSEPEKKQAKLIQSSNQNLQKNPKQKLVVGILIAIFFVGLTIICWNKYNTAKEEREAAKARRETHNQFAFEFSTLLTTLKNKPSQQSDVDPFYKSTLQYDVQPYLDYFDTNIRMYGGWLSSDELDHLNKLIDELQSIQFFAKKSTKEGMFADLSDEDKQMITHCDLSSNKRVWNVWTSSIDKTHPRMEIFRQSLINDGIDPDSGAGFEACSDYAKDLIAKAEADKTAYDAAACLDIMVERTTKTVGNLFDEFSK